MTSDTAYEISVWCGGILVQEKDALDPTVSQPGINVPTGYECEIKRASIGDVVIKHHDGTFQVLK